MANDAERLSKFSLKNITLDSSNLKIFFRPSGKAQGNASIKLSNNIEPVVIKDKKIEVFAFTVEMEIHGTIDDPKEKDLISVACTATGTFKSKTVGDDIEFLNENDMHFFSQIYLFMREHLVMLISKSGITGLRLPWGYGLDDLESSDTRPKKQAKKKKAAKKSTRKKVKKIV